MTFGKEAGKVGIFWAVPVPDRTHLVTDASGLSDAEPYGDNLTHPNGHFETWSAWQARGPAGLARRGLPVAIAWHEYMNLPRGRIVFHVPDGWFTAYADRRLLTPAMQARIIAAFALPADRTRWLTDSHYRTARSSGDGP